MVFGAPDASNRRGYAKLVEIDSKKVLKLVGNNEGDDFGRRVSISNSGNRVAVAAKRYIKVYFMEDGSLKQLGDDISSDWPRVALSAGGDVLGIGEYRYDNYQGRASIMKWDGGRWNQIGGDIVGANLDLSANGQRVLIGTHLRGNYVKAYKYDGSDWQMMGNKLEGGYNDDYMFGSSVSLSNDGNRIVVGSPYYRSDGLYRRGRVLVFHYHDGDWKQIGDDIVGEKAYVVTSYYSPVEAAIYACRAIYVKLDVMCNYLVVRYSDVAS